MAATLNPDGWVLVGGLMVHCHARRAGVTHVRPTDDADIVVELQTQTYAAHAAALLTLGFTPHESVDSDAPFHRFLRDGETVDLMVPDRESWSPRYRGRELIKALHPRSNAQFGTSFTMEPVSASRISHPHCR